MSKFKDSFDLDVLQAVKSIEKENKDNLLPYPRTIASFLCGKKASPFYDIFKKYKSLCGCYDQIDESEVKRSLERLFRKGYLLKASTRNGKTIYICKQSAVSKSKKDSKKTKKAKTKSSKNTSKPNDENLTFFESANSEEQSVLNEFRRLVKPLLNDHILQDNKSTYGFAPRSINGEITYKRCWISRDKETRKLNLHFKKNIDSSDKVLPLTTRSKINEAWRQLRIAYGSAVGEIDTIVERIKNKDEFNDYQTDNVINISLMPHQKAGVELAAKYDRFAFFYDTGTGKTVMALEIMMHHQIHNRARFIVVAPKALIKSAWLDDSKYFPKMKILPLSKNMTTEDYAQIYDYWQMMDGKPRAFTDEDGNLLEKIPNKIKEDILQELYAKAQHFIINIDSIREPKKGQALLSKIKANGMIIDESVIIKNYESANAQRMRVFARKMKYVYLLSGKPAPNTTIEYYSQMKIIDPETFSLTYEDFIEKYYQQVKFRYVDKNDKTRAEVARMVGNRSIIIKKEECIQLPEAFHQRRIVDIDDETKSFYRDILNNFIAEIVTMDGQKLKVTKMSKLASIMKLREVASGFYLNREGSYSLNPHKINAIKDLLDEIGFDSNGKPNKVLIWCNFKYEILSVAKALSDVGYKVVTAYSDTKHLDDNIASFKYGDADIMIAHPQTLKYGVTFTACHYCIFSSMSYSYDDYYQAHDRIYRKGQENVCFFYHLLSEDTIDEIIYRCVIEKASKAKLFERLVKSASKHGISKDDIMASLHVSQYVKEVATNTTDLTSSY